jgi:hypothetical protein
MSISASVTSQPITASAIGGSITASVGSSTVVATAGGGVGPQGPAGAAGTAGAGLGDLTNVELSGVADGDLLRYSSAKWRNVNQAVVTDGGNFLILLSLLLVG